MKNRVLKKNCLLLILVLVICFQSFFPKVYSENLNFEQKLKCLLVQEITQLFPDFNDARIEVKFSNQEKIKNLNEVFSDIEKNKISLKNFSLSDGLNHNQILQVFIDDGKKINIFKIPVKISIFKKVISAQKNIKKEQIIKEDDIYLKEEDLTQIPKTIFFDVSKVIGLEAVFSIPKNRVITSWMVRRVPDIKKNNLVNLELNSGNIFIKTKVYTLTDGYIGGKILVMNPSTKKKFEAEVKDKGIVILKI